MLKGLVLAIVLAALPGAGQAAATPCPQFFAGGAAPELMNPKLASQTQELCFREFTVLHSGLIRTPLWSAEHLTRQQLAGLYRAIICSIVLCHLPNLF